MRSPCVLALLFLSCSTVDNTATPISVCAAGQQIACVCTSGEKGAQVCKADGSGYEMCVCGTSGSTTSSVGAGGAGGSSATTATTTGGGQGGAATTSGVGGSMGAGGAGGGGPSTPFSVGFPVPAGQVSTRDVAVDAQGAIVVVGLATGTVDFGLGALPCKGSPGYNSFVVKFDANGKPLWNKMYGSGGPNAGGGQKVMKVRVDAVGNVLFAGQFENSVDFGGGKLTSAGTMDGFVVKLKPNGDQVYSYQFGGASSEEVWTLAVASNGDALVTADSGGSVDFGGGYIGGPQYSTFLFRLDGSGKHVFSKSLGCMEVGSVTVDSGGNEVYLATSNTSCPPVDLGGGPLQQKNGVVYGRFDPAGKFLSQKQFLLNKSGASWVYGAESDADDHVAFSIRAQSQDMASLDFGGGKTVALPVGNSAVLGVADKTGAGVFGNALPGKNVMAEIIQGEDVAVDAGKNVFFGGQFNASIDFGAGPVNAAVMTNNVFLAKYTSAGKLVWGKTFGPKTTGYAWPAGVAVDGSGAPVIAGNYGGMEIDFGQGALPAATPSGMFVARLAP